MQTGLRRLLARADKRRNRLPPLVPTRAADSLAGGPGLGADGSRHGVHVLCQHPGVDRAYYEEIAGLLRGLLIRLDDRLQLEDVTLAADFIDHNELGLALEQMTYALSEGEHALSPDERVDILALATRMQMGDRVAGALELCPAKRPPDRE